MSPPTITKVFGAAAINVNAATSLTFTLTNPNAITSLTGVAFTDSLPAGLVVATPNNLTSTCGGTATASAGASSASLSGATLAAGVSCTLAVNVTGTTPGDMHNSVQVNSSNGGIGNTSNATVTVMAAAPEQLSLFIIDFGGNFGGGYARYGQVAYYYVELVNSAASTSSSIDITLSAGLDAANATLTCTPFNGASCSANGSHVLSDTATLPQGGAAVWLLGVPVFQGASGSTVEVDVNAPGATPPTTSAVSTLVIFHDGFGAFDTGGG